MRRMKYLSRSFVDCGFLFMTAEVIHYMIMQCANRITARQVRRLVRHLAAGCDEVTVNVHDYRMRLNANKEGIHSQLIRNGQRERLASSAVMKLLRPGDVVLEVGANIGYYALMAARGVGPNGKVYAVEPASANMAYLQANVTLNELVNVDFYQLAFGADSGQVELNIYDMENWNSIFEIACANAVAKEMVTMTTVDEFLVDKDKPDFIRMDVEGYEYKILLGMKELLGQNPPKNLFIETHFGIMGDEMSVSYLQLLKRNGYSISQFIHEDEPSPPIWGLSRLICWLERKMEQRLQRFVAGEMVSIAELLGNRALRRGSPEIIFSYDMR